MIKEIAAGNKGAMASVILGCAATLERVACYKLPAAVDRRLLWLSENKGTLTQAEREELDALVDFSEDRTVEKLQAKTLLKRLAEVWPQHFGSTP